MGEAKKTLIKILDGRFDKNISFHQLCGVLKKLGFREKIKGSHHIFFKKDIVEILNVQAKGKHAKPYQVKQVRSLVLKYKLHTELKDERK